MSFDEVSFEDNINSITKKEKVSYIKIANAEDICPNAENKEYKKIMWETLCDILTKEKEEDNKNTEFNDKLKKAILLQEKIKNKNKNICTNCGNEATKEDGHLSCICGKPDFEKIEEIYTGSTHFTDAINKYKGKNVICISCGNSLDTNNSITCPCDKSKGIKCPKGPKGIKGPIGPPQSYSNKMIYDGTTGTNCPVGAKGIQGPIGSPIPYEPANSGVHTYNFALYPEAYQPSGSSGAYDSGHSNYSNLFIPRFPEDFNYKY